MDARVLLTGATGYIGGRLLRRFEQRGRSVCCLVRQPARFGPTHSTTDVVQGDGLDEGTLDRALTEIDTAYAYWYFSLPLHAWMFRRMLARIARRAVDAAASHPSDVFTYRSIVTGQAADVFRWHERPEALLDLLPSRRFVRIERRTGDLRDGGSVAFSIGIEWDPHAVRSTDRSNAGVEPSQGRYIRASKESHMALARRFGVGPVAIKNVRARKTWKHVADEET